MKRSYIYITVFSFLLAITAIGFYAQRQLSNNKLAINNSNCYYIDRLEYNLAVKEWRNNKRNKSHPLSNLVKDNFFVLEFEGRDSIVLIRVYENFSSGDSIVKFKKWELNKKHYDTPINLKTFQKNVIGWEGIANISGVYRLSKSKFLDYIDSASNINGLYGEISNPRFWDDHFKRSSATFPNKMIGYLVLIVFCSWLFSFLVNNNKERKRKLELIFYPIIPWLYQSVNILWSNSSEIYFPFHSIMYFGIVSIAVIIFQITKRRINRLKDFADRESIKALYIIFGVILIRYLSLLIRDAPSGGYFFGHFQLVHILDGLAIAIPNFLNNLRAEYYELRRQGKKLKRSEVKQQVSESELSALQSRVNPHFLYNSLNSIAALSESNPTKTRAMALALSDFYKYSTNREDQIWTTCKEEIEMITKYLQIEKIRFGDKLTIDIVCDEVASDFSIPKFLIQPLVENAIKYGYNISTDMIQVVISIGYETSKKKMTISVADSGPDFPVDLDMGHGIRSVQKKLALTYPKSHSLSFINNRIGSEGQQMKQVEIIIENPRANA